VLRISRLGVFVVVLIMARYSKNAAWEKPSPHTAGTVASAAERK
jgi:hypothetical protein